MPKDGMAMRVDGDEALILALTSLGPKIVKKHLRRILTQEAKPLVKEAKRFLRASLKITGGSTGLLAKSLGSKVVAFGQERVKTPKGYRYTSAAKGLEIHIGPRRGTGRLVADPEAKTQKGRFLSQKRSRLVKRATTRKQRKSFGLVFQEPTRYAHLVHRGIRGTKVVIAVPFLTQAYLQGKRKAIPSAQRKLWEAVKKEARASAQAAAADARIAAATAARVPGSF